MEGDEYFDGHADGYRAGAIAALDKAIEEFKLQGKAATPCADVVAYLRGLRAEYEDGRGEG